MDVDLIDERLKECRAWVRKMASLTALGIQENGDRVPGQMTVLAWKLFTPEDACPSEAAFVTDFAIEERELLSEHWEDVLKLRWTAAMMFLWQTVIFGPEVVEE